MVAPNTRPTTSIEKWYLLLSSPFVQNIELELPAGRTVYITDDETGLSEAICHEFSSRNIQAELLTNRWYQTWSPARHR